jgi:serine/threonine-protein kinase
MELLTGQELAAVMIPGRGLALERVNALVAQATSGLAAAHAVGVVHRDLKPANLFLETIAGSEQEMVRILDFGISKVRDTQTVTNVSMLIGTPQYMSPEQATGGQVDARSDQFALAALVYEMLTGHAAFAAEDPSAGDATPAVLFRVVHQDPPSFATFRLHLPAVETVLKRALAKKRDDRFPDVNALGKAFDEAARRDARSLPAALRGTVALPGTAASVQHEWAGPDTLRAAAGETRVLPTPALGSRSRAPRRPAMVATAMAMGVVLGGAVLLLFARGHSPVSVKPAEIRPAEIRPKEARPVEAASARMPTPPTETTQATQTEPAGAGRETTVADPQLFPAATEHPVEPVRARPPVALAPARDGHHEPARDRRARAGTSRNGHASPVSPGGVSAPEPPTTPVPPRVPAAGPPHNEEF